MLFPIISLLLLLLSLLQSDLFLQVGHAYLKLVGAVSLKAFVEVSLELPLVLAELVDPVVPLLLWHEWNVLIVAVVHDILEDDRARCQLPLLLRGP
jgi:hypothetical protein